MVGFAGGICSFLLLSSADPASVLTNIHVAVPYLATLELV